MQQYLLWVNHELPPQNEIISEPETLIPHSAGSGKRKIIKTMQ
jgi:hypothetical protein